MNIVAKTLTLQTIGSSLPEHTTPSFKALPLPKGGERGIFPLSFHNRSGTLDTTDTMPIAVVLKRKADIRC